MAYSIFLKSLGSLEEFWEKSYIKIPSKSPCVKFQSFDKFLNYLKNSKGYFLLFRPKIAQTFCSLSSPNHHIGLWGLAAWLAQPTRNLFHPSAMPTTTTVPCTIAPLR
jgi:hypothetical protein